MIGLLIVSNNMLIKYTISILVLIAYTDHTCAEDEFPEVETSLGVIRGSVMYSRQGNPFSAFRAIPYAVAPIDRLRFKDPIEVEEYTDIIDGTVNGPMCPQPFVDFDLISEDCLHLNIYTNNLNGSLLQSVIFYVHGGGFNGGSGTTDNVGPEYLLDRDIVLVTINYRLGPFGLLSTGTVDSPGNMGMKDQVLALKWVKAHISNFGGDPNSVTVMGHSAGGMAISLLMVSPMAQGLFHRAIPMSGAATAQWEIKDNLLELSQRLSQLVNCTISSPSEMVNCLRQVPHEDITSRMGLLTDFSEFPLLTWLPVIERDFGQERFLTEQPITTILRGNFAALPTLAGMVQDEFVSFPIRVLMNDQVRVDLDQNWIENAPICFLYEHGTERSRNISQILRENFITGELVYNTSISELQTLFGDGIIGFGVHRFVQLLSSLTEVFYYKTTYVGRFSILYYPGDEPFGVEHGDDLQYVIHLQEIGPLFNDTDPEIITVERMTRFWTNFAKTGNPNADDDEFIGTTNWTQFSIDQPTYLDIGDVLSVKENLFTNRFQIWDELFPLDNYT